MAQRDRIVYHSGFQFLTAQIESENINRKIEALLIERKWEYHKRQREVKQKLRPEKDLMEFEIFRGFSIY